LHANQIIEILPNSFEMFSLQNLSDHANFWGRDVSDERYTIIADKRQEPGSLKSALEGLDNSDPSDV
jgi:hypothetical protein